MVAENHQNLILPQNAHILVSTSLIPAQSFSRSSHQKSGHRLPEQRRLLRILCEQLRIGLAGAVDAHGAGVSEQPLVMQEPTPASAH